MVAIISSETLGLFNSTGTLAGLESDFMSSGTGQIGQAGEHIFVNAANGNLVVQRQDDGLQGLGIDASFLRTYNSLGQLTGNSDGDNDDDWRLGFSRNISQVGDDLQRTTADGGQQLFKLTSTNAGVNVYTSTLGQGSHDTLTQQADGRYSYVEGSSQLSEQYDANGRLDAIVDKGEKGLHFLYLDATSKLIDEIAIDTNTTIDTVKFVYIAGSKDPAQNLLASYTLHKGASDEITRIDYGYDAQDRLNTVKVDLTPADKTDNLFYTTTYAYRDNDTNNNGNLLLSVSNSDGTNTSFSYYADDKVHTVTDGAGNVTSFSYDDLTTEVSIDGTTYQYTYDNAGRLKHYRGEVQNQQYLSTRYVWDENSGDLLSITDSNNDTIDYSYDDNGNQTLQRDALGNTITRQFDIHNQLIEETRVDQASGDATNRFIYDANQHLRFSVSAQGRVTEQQFNGLGQRVKQLVFTEQMVAGSSFDLADLAAWSATQSSTASNIITTFGYNFRGQLETTTQGDSTTRYIYDARGQLLKQLDGKNQSTDFAYDGLGRLQSSTDANGVVTTFDYQDNLQSLAVTNASGLVTTQVFDGNRALVSITQGIATDADQFGTERFIYDSHNRLVASQDENGATRYQLYNLLGQKTADVDGEGRVTSYRYTADGQLAATTQHGNLANTTGWLNEGQLTVNGEALPVATASDDRTTEVTYDAAGRQQFIKDADGYVTEFRYNSQSELIATLAYENGVDGTYRLIRQFYSADGQLRATMDGEGYITELHYNGAGQLIAQTVYGDKTSADIATATLTELLPTTTDQHTSHRYYDNKGQLRAQIDHHGKATTFDYDLNGQLTMQREYATAVTNATLGGPLPTLSQSAGDQVITHSYTAVGQLASTTDASGLLTTFSYDPAGNLIKTQAGSRMLIQQYDASGQLTGQLSGEAVNALSLQLAGVSLETALADNHALINQFIDADGNRFVYDLAGRLLRSTDGEGFSTVFYYNQADQLVRTVSAEGVVTDSGYNDFGEVASQTVYATKIAVNVLATFIGGDINSSAAITPSANDSTTTTHYNQRGLVDYTLDGESHRTVFGYNAFAQLSQRSTQINGSTDVRTDTFGYDNRGLQTSALQGGQVSTASQYDGFGRVINRTDGNGNLTTIGYDDTTHSTQTTLTNSSSSQVFYDVFGRITSQIDANGNTSTTQYLDNNRHIKQTSAAGITSHIYLNAFGDVERTVIDGIETRFSYDAAGNTVAKTVDDVLVSSKQFDSNNQLVLSLDGEGRQVKYLRDSTGNITSQIIDPDGLASTTSYQYSALGLVKTALDGDNRKTQYHYDKAGRLTDEVVFISLTETAITHFTYNDVGQQTSVTTGFGTSGAIVVDYQYDHLGRITKQIRHPQVDKIFTTDYVYDDNGNLLQKSTDSAQNHYVYDNANRLIYTLDGAGGLSQNHYDANNNLTSVTRYQQSYTAPVTAPAAGDIGFTTRYVYDQDNRLTLTISANLAVTENRYNDRGLVNEQIRYHQPLALWTDSPVASGADQHTATIYDNHGQARYTLQRLANGKAQVKESQYDNSGLLVLSRGFNDVSIDYSASLTEASLTEQINSKALHLSLQTRSSRFYYDGAKQLRFTLDSGGSLSETSYTAAGLVSANISLNENLFGRVGIADGFFDGTLSFGDIDSQITLSRVDANARVTSNQYDGAGRLTSVTDAAGFSEFYTYDGNGLKATFTDKNGHVWSYGYDGEGRLSREVSPAAVHSWLDSNNIVQSKTVQALTTFTYDSQGNVLSQSQGHVDNSVDNGVDTILRTQQFSYNAVGQQTTITPDSAVNADDYSSTVQYNALGQAVIHTITINNTTINSYKIYNEIGQLTIDIDANGYATSYQYDALGNQTAMTRHAIKVTLSDTNINALTDSNVRSQLSNTIDDRTVEYHYDNLGRQTKIEMPAVVYWQGSLNQSGASNAKPTTEISYNAFGEVTLQRVQQNATTWSESRMSYDTRGNQILSVDGEGYATGHVYDALGQKVQTIEYAGSGQGRDRTTDFVYDTLGRQTFNIQRQVFTTDLQTRQSSTRDISSETRYDALGNIETLLLQNVIQAQQQYDVLGRLTQSTGATHAVGLSQTSQQAVTQMQYDIFGNLTEQRQLSGGEASDDIVTRFAYNGRDQQIAQHDSTAKPINRFYDYQGNLVRETRTYTDVDIKTKVTEFGFDAVGQKISQQVYSDDGSTQLFSQKVAILHNAFGEVIGQDESHKTLASDYAERFNYDNGGRLISTNAQDGINKSYGYNLAGQLVQTDKTGYGITENTLDKLGRTISQKQAAFLVVGSVEGVVTTPQIQQTFDRWGNITEYIDAAGYSSQYQYNQQNQMTKETRSLVKVVSETGAVTYQQPTSENQYDDFGRLVSSKDANGVLRFQSYNAVGKLTSKTDGNGHSTKAYYDVFGRQVANQSAGGYTTVKQFDHQGNVTRSGDIRNGTAQWLSESSYNEIGHRIHHTDANGHQYDYVYNTAGKLVRSKSPQGVIKSYSFDVRGFKTQEKNDNLYNSNKPDEHQLNWTYDYFGNIENVNDLAGNQHVYSQQAGSNLTEKETSTDVDGNSGKDKTISYYANGQVKRIDARSGVSGNNNYSEYQYDVLGRLVEEHTFHHNVLGEVTEQTSKIQYDSLGRMITVTIDDASVEGSINGRTRYSYDANGNRRSISIENGYQQSITAQQTPQVFGGTAGNDSLSGGQGDDYIAGLGGDDILDGLAGNDTLDGGAGSDTYLFGRGDGHDIILPASGRQLTDILQFKSGLSGADISVSQSGNDKVFTINDSGETVTIKDWFSLSSVGVQLFMVKLADGSVLAKTNEAVTATAINNQAVIQGEVFNLEGSRYFTDNDTLTYAVSYETFNATSQSWDSSGAPAGLSFNSNTGLVSGTATVIGLYRINLSATDNVVGNASAQSSFELQVLKPNSAPVVLNPVADMVFTKGQVVDYSVPTNLFSDVDGDALTLSVAGLLPVGLFYNPDTDKITGSINGLVNLGDYAITITAKDNRGGEVQQSFTITILAEPNTAPVTNTSVLTYSAKKGLPLSYTIPAGTFTDPDGDALTLTATNLPTGLSFSNGVLSGTVNAIATYVINIVARDPEGLMTTATLNLSITSVFGGGGGFGGVSGSSLMAKSQSKAVQQLAPQATQTLVDDDAQQTAQQTTGVSTTPATVEQHWFSYDNENQVVMDGGLLDNGVISIKDQGQQIFYDIEGRQQAVIREKGFVSDFYYYDPQGRVVQVDRANLKVGQADNFLNEIHDNGIGVRDTYASQWGITIAHSYDMAGHNTQTLEYYSPGYVFDISNRWEPNSEEFFDLAVDFTNSVRRVTDTLYNQDGQVSETLQYGFTTKDMLAKAFDTARASMTGVWDEVSPQITGREGVYATFYRGTVIPLADKSDSSFVSHGLSHVSNLYDTAGRKLSHIVETFTDHTVDYSHQFVSSYQGQMTYLDTKVTGTNIYNGSGNGSYTPTSTLSHYDDNGNRMAVEQISYESNGTVVAGSKVQARYFDYNQNNQLIHRLNGVQDESFLAHQGQANIRQNIGFNENTATAGLDNTANVNFIYAGGQYLGELRRDGSSQIKGQHFSARDASSASSTQKYTVAAGDSLRALAGLFYGNSDYWYIIADANGLADGPDDNLDVGITVDVPQRASTSNTFADFKPQNLAQIIGDTTPSLAYVPEPPPEVGCNVAASIIMIVIAVVVTYVTNGAASEAMGAMVGGFISGAAGSAASQIAGNAMGAVDGFSMQAMFASGITAGLSYGASGYLQGAEALTTAGATVGSVALNTAGNTFLAGAGALSNVAANKLVGYQDSFSWREVAVSMVGAFVGDKVGLNRAQSASSSLSSSVMGQAFSGIGQAGLNHGLNQLAGQQSHFNFKNVALDSFANALGNGLVNQLRAPAAGVEAAAQMQAMAADKVAVGAGSAGQLAGGLQYALAHNTEQFMATIGANQPSTLIAEGSAVGSNSALAERSNRVSTYLSQHGDYLANMSQYNQGIRADNSQRAWEEGIVTGIAHYNLGKAGRDAKLMQHDFANVDNWNQQQKAGIFAEGGMLEDTFSKVVKTGLGIAADLALLTTGFGMVGLGGRIAFQGLKGVVRGSLISGFGQTSTVAGAGYLYGGYGVAQTGVNTAMNAANGVVGAAGGRRESAASSYVKGLTTSVIATSKVAGAASSILDDGGLMRVSLAASLLNKDFEVKLVQGLYNDNESFFQAKLPNQGTNFTQKVADDLGIKLGGFKKDNINMSGRYDFSSGLFSTTLETDSYKNDLMKSNRFGKLKASIGARTSNGVTGPAVNIGWEWMNMTVSAEFRAKAAGK
ncbi:MAG: YD repeat-containing protein [Phenylobacterium sp.]|jgi:YD repeat-containing protein